MRTSGPQRAAAAACSAASCPASRTGLTKNEPALRVSGSPGSSTISLAPAQRQHSGVDLPERRLLALGHAKPLRQFPVAHWPGQRVKAKPKNHIQHNDPPRVLPQPASRRGLASAALEGAGPVAEPAVPPGQLDHLAAGPVVRMDQGDGLGDLL